MPNLRVALAMCLILSLVKKAADRQIKALSFLIVDMENLSHISLLTFYTVIDEVCLHIYFIYF